MDLTFKLIKHEGANHILLHQKGKRFTVYKTWVKRSMFFYVFFDTNLVLIGIDIGETDFFSLTSFSKTKFLFST